jgi:hypothetical protein
MATQFSVDERQYTLSTSWDDVTLDQYIQMGKLNDSTSRESIIDSILGTELYSVKLFEIMSNAQLGELDDMILSEMNELMILLDFLTVMPELKPIEYVNVDGVDHTFKTDLNKITNGEYISIKTLQETGGSQWDIIPMALAVLVRPSSKVDGLWKQDKFNIESLVPRSKQLLKIKATDLLGSYDFFLSGKKE